MSDGRSNKSKVLENKTTQRTSAAGTEKNIRMFKKNKTHSVSGFLVSEIGIQKRPLSKGLIPYNSNLPPVR